VHFDIPECLPDQGHTGSHSAEGEHYRRAARLA
jgi:hypothetical protein